MRLIDLLTTGLLLMVVTLGIAAVSRLTTGGPDSAAQAGPVLQARSHLELSPVRALAVHAVLSSAVPAEDWSLNQCLQIQQTWARTGATTAVAEHIRQIHLLDPARAQLAAEAVAETMQATARRA